jgi:hypothetical protein
MVFYAMHFHWQWRCIPYHTIPFPMPMHTISMQCIPYQCNAYHTNAMHNIAYHTMLWYGMLWYGMICIGNGNGNGMHWYGMNFLSISLYGMHSQCIPYHIIANSYHCMHCMVCIDMVCIGMVCIGIGNGNGMVWYALAHFQCQFQCIPCNAMHTIPMHTTAMQ